MRTEHMGTARDANVRVPPCALPSLGSFPAVSLALLRLIDRRACV
jgi:hypothetical protein